MAQTQGTSHFRVAETSHLPPWEPPQGPLSRPLAQRVTGQRPPVMPSTQSPHPWQRSCHRPVPEVSPMNMVLRPGYHRFARQAFRQALNPGAAGDGEHRLGVFGLVDDVQEKIMDALAIDAHLQDLHLFAFQAEGHVQGRGQFRHLLAAAAHGIPRCRCRTRR